MQYFASLAVIFVLLFLFAYFNNTILAMSMYPGIQEPRIYNNGPELFTSLTPNTSLDFPWTLV
jgi:hypothetical protein